MWNLFASHLFEFIFINCLVNEAEQVCWNSVGSSWQAGAAVAQSDTEQGAAAELPEHQGHLLEPQFSISVTAGVGILCDSPPS